MKLRSLSSVALVVAGFSFVSACSSGTAADSAGSGGSNGSVESNLEIFSWWIAPGEVEALDALLGVYADQYPDVEVTNAAAVDAKTQRDRLKTRLETGEPPDSYQALSGVDLLSWVDKSKMVSLQSMSEDNGWDKVFPQVLLDIVSRDGDLYAVPLNIERDNNLYYNKALFTEYSVQPPETLDDFYAACETFKSGGLETPLAVPAAGWVLALVTFETLMPAVAGGDFYRSYFDGMADAEDPKVEELFTALKKVIECSNVATASDAWGAGGDALYNGDAAMYVMGDWGKAYLERGQDNDSQAREPWVADEDFGVVPGLGSKGYFTFNSTVFGLPKGAPHPKAARAFLEVVGSKEGQQAFNPIKGSLPARTDVDLSDFDDITQKAGADFKAAAEGANKLLPGYASLTLVNYQNAINPSLLVFAVGGERAKELDVANVPDSEVGIQPLDVDYIVGKMRVNYPLLQK